MKVSITFDIDNPSDLEKINEAIKQVVPEYKVNLELGSEDINQEENKRD